MAQSPQAIIKRALELLERWKRQHPDADPSMFGGVSIARQGSIDDGLYGDPLRDERPDFIKQDDEWTSNASSSD